jgi:BTB/POZ domain
MDSRKGTETREMRLSKSRSREAQLKTALYNANGDMNIAATSMIYAALRPLYESGKLSDLTVTCGGRRFLVHKAIVCSQSPFFDMACNSGFRVG